MSSVALFGATMVGIGMGMMAYGIAMNATTPETSVTYDWSGAKNYSKEGGCWPVLYGTMRVTPPLLNKYIATNDNEQTINLLYGVADHVCDSLTSVEINQSPSTYFDSVSLTTDRLGSTSQVVIPQFSDTMPDIEVGVKLTGSYITRRTIGNELNALGFEISMPAGLYHVADDGSLENYTVTFTIEYKLVADSVYTKWQDVTLNESSSSAIRKYYRLDNLTPGQYDIRVKFVDVPQSTTRYSSVTCWEMYQEIVYDDFSYPGATLLALQSLATSSLSGTLPAVTVIAARLTVPVWTGTAYENKPANNPAWAAYDMLHNDDYGGGIPYTRIIYADFADWADFCDDEGYTCNIYFDTIYNFRRAVDAVALLGRGCIVQRGSKYTVIIDRPYTVPVQGFLFTQANIIEDSFTHEWIPPTERSNVLEMTYWDAAENYSKQTFQLYSHDFETTVEEVRTKSITLYGCTDRDMAIKFGKITMNINRYLTQKMAWIADIDSIACAPGDLVEVAHDFPAWGFSGRVISSTNSTVTIDRQVTMEPGKDYRIVIRHNINDVREEQALAAVAITTTTNILHLATGTWTLNPALHDNYSFGEEDHVTQLARVIAITRAQNGRRAIKVLEYNSAAYTDTSTIGIIESAASFVGVSGLRAEEVYVPSIDGVGSSHVLVLWRGQAIKWGVYYRESNVAAWTYLDTVSTPQYRARGLTPGKTYEFSVTETDAPGYYTTAIAYVGMPTVPDAATALTATIIGQSVILAWTEPDSITTLSYNIYLNNVLIASNVYGDRYVYYGDLSHGSFVFKVVAVDPYGQPGSDTTAGTLVVAVPSTPSPLSVENGGNCNHILGGLHDLIAYRLLSDRRRDPSQCDNLFGAHRLEWRKNIYDPSR